MAKSFDELTSKLPLEVQEKITRRTAELIGEMTLSELREARQLSQEVVAESFGVKQAAISRMERRTDIHISTLKSFIESLGGELEIRANFPEGIVKINQFTDGQEATA